MFSRKNFLIILSSAILFFILSIFPISSAYAVCTDNDADGYGSPGDASCPKGSATDCNDTDPKVYPGAPKNICDGKDTNCDGRLDFSTDVDADADGVLWCAGDCADNDPARFPGNPEICDGKDNDCNSVIPANERDSDKDGSRLCDPIPDCNDNDASIKPGTPEICGDYKDNNCNGTTDETPCTCPDADADGQTASLCGGLDCNDSNPNVYLGAVENCTDSIDNDCDGLIDIRDPNAVGCPACTDNDKDTYYVEGGGCGLVDCDDTDPKVYPGAIEICDGKDNNCDGKKPSTDVDADADGVLWCAGDCNDSNPNMFPGNPEVCDGIDNNCNGIIPTNERDIDNDGSRSCDPIPDCNDNDSTMYPGAAELCGDKKDNNCNGIIDELSCICPDGDVDGQTASYCGGTDCNDSDPTVYAGAVEVCTDGIDNDCDGLVDRKDPNAVNCPICTDADNDGYAIDGGLCGQVDCDDTDPRVYPGAPKNICDGKDTNCDGRLDFSTDVDADADGVLWCAGDCNDNNPNMFPGNVEGPYGNAKCNDSIDNDCDTRIDAVDSDCAPPTCITKTSPKDGPHMFDLLNQDGSILKQSCQWCHYDSTGTIDQRTACQRCHADPADTSDPLNGTLKQQYPLNPPYGFGTAKNVKMHSSTVVGSNYGNWDMSCLTCHNPHLQEQNARYGTTYGKYIKDYVCYTNNVTGVTTNELIQFTASSGAGSFADGPPYNQNICNMCHTQTNHHQNDGVAPGGQDHNNGTNCMSCHSHNVGFKPAGGSADPPHNAITNCYYCHVDGQPYTTPIPDSKCEQCHTPMGSLKAHYMTAPDVKTHSSANNPSGSNYNFINTCITCHDPMHAQSNLKHIRSTISGSVISGSNIVFTSQTGAGSFADGAPYNENVCQTCHTQTNHQWYNGAALLDNRNGYVGHNDETRCTICHSHNGAFLPDMTPPPFPHDTAACSACHTMDGLGRLQDAYTGAPITNAKCDACHAPGSPDGGSGGSNKKVIEHYSNTYLDPATGLMASLKCIECHNPMRAQVNFRLNNNLVFIRSTIRGNNVAFESYTGQYGFASDSSKPSDMLTANYLCNACHTQTNHHQNDGTAAGGQSHNDGADCRSCHAHNAGFVITAAAPPPHNAFNCKVCHVTPYTYVQNADIPNSACQSCHDITAPGTGAGGSNLKVDRHYSGTYIDPTTGLLMDIKCVECHNPMSVQTNFRGITNLKFVRNTIRGNSISFEALTGQYSFASDNNIPVDMTTVNYVCNTCHTQTNHHQADGTAPGGQNHNDGTKCTSCHFHDAGFQPAGNCLLCHNSMPPAGSSDTRRRQITESTPGTGDFVRTSHHVTNGTTSQIVNQDVCLVCHDQTNHTTYGDGISVLMINQDSGAGITYNGTGTTAETFCASCHDANGSTLYGSTPFNQAGSGDANTPKNIGWTSGLMSHSSSEACFNCHGDTAGNNAHGSQNAKLLKYSNYTSGASQTFCYNCHNGTVASKNIQSVFARTYKHGNEDCQICHNQHQAQSGTHTPANQWYPSSVSSTTNNVSNVLKGVTGVEPTWPALWTAPTTFAGQNPATKEYQICFKCHSKNNAGGNPPGISTDQALEFNPNNKSAHPVVAGLNSQTGSTTPKALTSSQMSSPWTSVGTQTMMCSDCHGADAENAGDPKGPHGSSARYLLKGDRKLWPIGSTGKLFSLNDISGSNREGGSLNTDWSSTLFCLNCHNSFPSSDINTWKNKAHREHDDRSYKPDGVNTRNVYCVTCHSVIPHGNKRSRLIVYRSESAPYTYQSGGNNYAAITGFAKASVPFNYQKSNCSTGIAGSCHGTMGGSYDP